MAGLYRERIPGVLRIITRHYYLVWWTYSFAGAFIFGVYALFLRARGLNQFQINSVLAVYFIVTFLTDVPTGAFADAIGRRAAFMLSCATRTVGFAMYFFAHSYLLFLAAEFVDGVGTTFGNGALEAWAVDALDAAGFKGMKDRLFSRVSQLASLGFMFAALIGAYVADVDIAMPWMLGAAGYLGTGILAGVLMRGERVRQGGSARIEMRGLVTRVSIRMKAGLRSGFARRSRVLLTFASALQVAALAPYWLQWPQYVIDTFGSGMWVVGWMFCFFSCGRLLGAEAVFRFNPQGPARAGLLTALVGLAASLLFAAGWSGSRTGLVLTLLFGLNLCVGAIEPLARSWFNEEIEAEDRATLLSFQTTFGTLGGAIGLLISGGLADFYGISAAWELAGVILAAAAPCYWVLRAPSTTAPALTRATEELRG